MANDLCPGQILQFPFVNVQNLVGHLQIVLFGRGAVLGKASGKMIILEGVDNRVEI